MSDNEPAKDGLSLLPNMKLVGTTMVIEIDLSPEAVAAGRKSASGLSIVVASSGGNRVVKLPDGTEVKVGYTAFKQLPKEKKAKKEKKTADKE